MREKEMLWERLTRAESLAEGTMNEKEILEQEVKTMNFAHAEEKEELEKQMEILQAELHEAKRPWYEQAYTSRRGLS